MLHLHQSTSPTAGQRDYGGFSLGNGGSISANDFFVCTSECSYITYFSKIKMPVLTDSTTYYVIGGWMANTAAANSHINDDE